MEIYLKHIFQNMKFTVVFLVTAALLLALSDCETVHRPVAKWIAASNGNVPPNPVLVGTERDSGKPVYVCRAKHERGILPGKLVPHLQICYVPYGWKENQKRTYEVLTVPYGNTLEWVHTEGPELPLGAVQGGTTADGMPLYIGSTTQRGVIGSGKVENGILYLPFDGGEHKHTSFDVLVAKRC